MDLVDPLSEPCAVCGDKSTGTHYGVVSCNGCKGFFRRTILRDQKFTCRFNKKCVIDKNFRCACRFCRFQKCVRVGMKREAIQFERDSVGSTKHRCETPLSRTDDTDTRMAEMETPYCNDELISVTLESGIIKTLLEMEERTNQEMTVHYRNSVITSSTTAINSLRTGEIGCAPSAFSLLCRPTIDNLNELSKTTLVLMVDWAKGLKPFSELSMEDKIILLKNYAPQHLILVPAFRSPDATCVCLFNSTCVNREQGIEFDALSAFKTNNITPRVLDEIVWPIRQLQMKEEEFVCLKALAFMHPEAKGLSPQAQTIIREARNRVLKALYSYISTQTPEEAPTRYGNILLLAPALKALAQLLIENMTLTKFFGLAEVDSLLSEFILDSPSEQATAQISLQQRLTSSYPLTHTTNTCSDVDTQQRVMTIL